MKQVSKIEFHAGSKEERLPGFTADFPYIASCVDIGLYPGGFCPWHWHKSVELFYMKDGELEYSTPSGKWFFPAGSGGFLNSNVLHATKVCGTGKSLQLLHIFDPALIGGEQGSRISQKYVTPITASGQPEIIQLSPDCAQQAEILSLLAESFSLSEKEDGYELKLRNALSVLWLKLYEMVIERLPEKSADHRDDKVKTMMIYIHEHYAERITVSELAAAAFISERECFRAFRDSLHMTPLEYLTGYRLQMACQMLSGGNESVTFISQACGLGSSSYFGKVFHEQLGSTPLEYRRKWQNRDI